MTKNNNEWKIKQAEWRGYVAKSLEDLDEKVDKIDKKVDKLADCVSNMQIKMAGIGAASGLIVTIVLKLFLGV